MDDSSLHLSGTVYTVDDDESVRRAISRIIEQAGWTARACDSGADLLRQLDDSAPACIVLDLSMPMESGIDLQRELLERKIDLPVIFLSGGASVPAAVTALRGGALDFMEKPVDAAVLIERIGMALREHVRRRKRASIRQLVDSLSPRELEICVLLTQGLASKQIAHQLSLSPRTVEHHRSRILQKTGTANTAELASLYALSRESTPEPE